jgi:hypothetical protein
MLLIKDAFNVAVCINFLLAWHCDHQEASPWMVNQKVNGGGRCIQKCIDKQWDLLELDSTLSMECEKLIIACNNADKLMCIWLDEWRPYCCTCFTQKTKTKIFK